MPCALPIRSEEHTSELQSHDNLVCRLLLEKTTKNAVTITSTDARRVPLDPTRNQSGPRHPGADEHPERVGARCQWAEPGRSGFFLRRPAPAESAPLPPPGPPPP